MLDLQNDRPPIRARQPRADLVGKRFGKLTVQSWIGESRWFCRCDCGKSTHVLTANLNTGNTASCGCVRNIASSKRATKHGLYNTRAYKTWASVKRRCFDVNCNSYQFYGARGISMWEEWAADPVAFVRDVGQPPSPNHTLDRIDNAKGYEPGNVRWATPLEQGNNKTNNVVVMFRGERYTLSQLARMIAKECGISFDQMRVALEHEMYGRRRK